MSDPISFRAKLVPSAQKKLLALDGGGILGAISIEYLVRIEGLLRKVLKRDESFVLADYFDYIAGTSTGAIIATCVALGMPAAEIRQFYHDHGPEMFNPSWFIERHKYKYTDENLAKMLRDTIDRRTGETETRFGSEKLRTLLMVVLRNVSTDSPWPLSNNPVAMYNDPRSKDSNLNLPLWRVVRASTAAPTYFPAEQLPVGAQPFTFEDGGVTSFNNPAFQLFLMATVHAYNLRWPAGEKKMLLVSVGTGVAPDVRGYLRPDHFHLLANARRIPSALMAAANAQQDFLCRVFGRCVHGAMIDREIHDMIDPEVDDAQVPGGKGPVQPKLFTYARYNPDLTQSAIDELLPGKGVRAEDVKEMDAVEHIGGMAAIGAAASTRDVEVKHFADFL